MKSSNKLFCGNSAVKQLDFYGKTLGFHYQGADKMRSYTGALISAVVFLAITVSAAYRMVVISTESHQTFQAHGPIEGFYEGLSTERKSNLSLAGLTEGELTGDQMEALGKFYVGVGFATTDQFEEYDERAFGSWKFFQHYMTVSGSGQLVEVFDEVETESCFAFLDQFYEPNATAKRLLERQDVRSSLTCVDKRKIQTLQPRSSEFWFGQPRYSFQFFACQVNCQSETLTKEWRKVSKGLLFHN